MILLLQSEIIDLIISNLMLNNLLLLRQTNKSFDNILDQYNTNSFFNSVYINELLITSYFTKALFYKYIEIIFFP